MSTVLRARLLKTKVMSSFVYSDQQI